jgi:hypothetical protein
MNRAAKIIGRPIAKYFSKAPFITADNSRVTTKMVDKNQTPTPL